MIFCSWYKSTVIISKEYVCATGTSYSLRTAPLHKKNIYLVRLYIVTDFFMCGKRLTLKERELIENQVSCGQSFRAIALMLGRSHTTVLREYRKHPKYCAQRAHRERLGPAVPKLSQSRSLRHYVQAKLADGWTAHTIAYALQTRETHRVYVSDNTIRARYPVATIPCVPGNTRKRTENTPIPYGLWEVDLTRDGDDVYFIAIESTSRHLYGELLQSDFHMCVQSAYFRLIDKYGPSHFREVRMDNTHPMRLVREASQHNKIYTPLQPLHQPWDRGRVENAIRCFKKFLRIHQSPETALHMCNTRPMRALHGETPEEVFTRLFSDHERHRRAHSSTA